VVQSGDDVTRKPREFFSKLVLVSRKGRECKGLMLIWHITLWSILRGRNDGVFKDKAAKVEDVVEHIQHVSWQWFVAKDEGLPCIFSYEWWINPRDCLLQK